MLAWMRQLHSTAHRLQSWAMYAQMVPLIHLHLNRASNARENTPVLEIRPRDIIARMLELVSHARSRRRSKSLCKCMLVRTTPSRYVPQLCGWLRL